MKFAILISIIGFASAGNVLLDTGASTQYRSQDNLGGYAFGYNEDHATGGTFRREKGDAWGNKVGSYGLRDVDGRVRIVNYIADEHGFRASIQTNEPGVAPKDPAAATINKEPVVAKVIAPAPAYIQPIYAPAPVAKVVAPVGLLTAPTVATYSKTLSYPPQAYGPGPAVLTPAYSSYVPYGAYGYGKPLAPVYGYYGGHNGHHGFIRK